MKHSLLNLLSSALVPILCADIATGTSCNVHLCLIAIAAMRTFPNELAVGIRTRGVRLAIRKAITADNLTAYVLDAPVERSTGCRGVVLIIENEYEEAALKERGNQLGIGLISETLGIRIHYVQDRHAAALANGCRGVGLITIVISMYVHGEVGGVILYRSRCVKVIG